MKDVDWYQPSKNPYLPHIPIQMVHKILAKFKLYIGGHSFILSFVSQVETCVMHELCYSPSEPHNTQLDCTVRNRQSCHHAWPWWQSSWSDAIFKIIWKGSFSKAKCDQNTFLPTTFYVIQLSTGSSSSSTLAPETRQAIKSVNK